MIETNVPMVRVTANIFFSPESLFFPYVEVKIDEEMKLSSEQRDHLTKLHLKSFWFFRSSPPIA
jgi:hypothetical protein